ncbi:MAG: magnesium transporter [Chitinophagaceae bacterium]|jgi:magnesium transporter|nr:magnesium transporter [Chitinophagaceae bacterium]
MIQIDNNMDLQEQFEFFLQEENAMHMPEFLNELNISDVAQLIEENWEQASEIMAALSIHRAASTFKIIELGIQKDIIQELPPLKTAALLNELPADDRTSFLEELSTNAVRELIKLLNPEERKITLSLLGYPEGSVGRLMTPDYIAVQSDWTIAEVLEHIREVGQESETIDVIYVINDQGELLDDVRIKEFLLSPPDKMVSELTDGRYIELNVYDDQEKANQVFKMNNRVALPVVDNNNILLGIVTIDDVLWVANEEFSEDMQKMGGTEALDEPYLEISIFKLFKKRVGWLIVLFLGEMLTATAMASYEHALDQALILSLFIPLIISSGGNTGSQASSLIIQALTVGEVTMEDWWKVMRREIVSGIMLGTVLGIIGFSRVMVWSQIFPEVYGAHYFLVAMVVGVSLIGVVMFGTISGSMLPIVLKRLGADPAVSSAPFVATLVDVTGVIIYFNCAYYFLKGTML